MWRLGELTSGGTSGSLYENTNLFRNSESEMNMTRDIFKVLIPARA